jgi:hypothetical protein
MTNNFKLKIKLISIFFLLFPSFLFCNNEIDNIKNDNFAISIIAVNYFINNQIIHENSSYSCKISFKDDYKKNVENKVDNKSNYIILKSNISKVYMDHITCKTHSIPLIFGKSRYRIKDDHGFYAYPNVINYVGDINIYYYPAKFKILDIFNFGGLSKDNGEIKIEVIDKTMDFLNFVNSRFINVKGLNIAKSILTESLNIKPNEKAPILSLNNLMQNNIENKENNNLNMDIKPDNSLIQTKNLTNFDKNIESVDYNSENIKKLYKIDNHPYKVLPYSEFYTNFLNPYYSIESNNNYETRIFTETQDMIVESPH